MSNGTISFNSRAALVAALEARRSFWKTRDDEAAERHYKEELGYFKAWNASMREAAKWTYAQAKDKRFAVPRPKNPANPDDTKWRTWGAPACPIREEARLDRVLREIALTQQSRFTIKDRGAWSEVHRLLTYDPDLKSDVC